MRGREALDRLELAVSLETCGVVAIEEAYAGSAGDCSCFPVLLEKAQVTHQRCFLQTVASCIR